MNIRPLHPDDIPAMVAILNEIIAIGGTTAYQTPVSEAEFDRFRLPANAKTFLHVAEADGAIIGFQWLSPDPEGLGAIASFAHPDAAQRGIGTALFAATKAAAIAAGYKTLEATIRADNASGLAYYSKMGFEDFQTFKDVPLSDGTPVDRIQKRLSL
jgi:L-amino acid N-acyltransferase YncA